MGKLHPHRKGSRSRGQATLEYALVMALMGLFGLFLSRYFLEVFSDGMVRLTQNIGVRLETGKNFRN